MKCHFRVLLFALLIAGIGASVCVAIPALQTTQPADETQGQVQESPPGYEEQYNCYQSATSEEDSVKRGTMLMECIKKYPDSTLMPNYEGEYRTLMFNSYTDKKWEELETLAEQWLTLHPDNPEATAYAADAAAKLHHIEKYIQWATKLFKMKPISKLAEDIADAYLAIHEEAKYIEWTEKAIEFPENKANYSLRLKLLKTYIEKKDHPKIMQWSQASLKSIDLVINPDEKTRKQLVEVRHFCHDIIGKIFYEQEKFPEAIKEFKEALKAKEYVEGYYYIGVCLHKQREGNNAMLWYAKTELWCEKHGEESNECKELAPKAKENLKMIYLPLHNKSDVGMFKEYDKAKEKEDSFWTS
jgi:tetratricopeptide (TPR) repeat protein